MPPPFWRECPPLGRGNMLTYSIREGRRTVILRLLLLASCFLVLGCGKKSLDSRTTAILAGATKVEVFRIDPISGHMPKSTRKEGEKRIMGFLVIAQGKDQGKEFADKLSQILFDRATYSDQISMCFDPGVAFRVWKDDEALDVLICFKCNNFGYGPPTDDPATDEGHVG